MSQKIAITMTLNDEEVEATVEPRTSLVDFVRSQGFTGPHVGCEHGVCGACTIEVDGQAVRGCLMLAVQADRSKVTTIEGLGERAAALRAAFHGRNALQCGFCTPGMLTSALEYIETGGSADRDKIREYISGNYCRCTGYQSIVDAIADVIGEAP